MNAKLYQLCLPSEVLRRGFWLNVWRIKLRHGGEVFYVGRTGDSSSRNAQSPFSRVSGHLGPNKRANALQSHLEKHKIKLAECEGLELVTYGPLFYEDEAQHRHFRDKTAALERDLCYGMRRVGYQVLNCVRSRKKSAPDELRRVLSAFAESFPALKAEHPIAENRELIR